MQWYTDLLEYFPRDEMRVREHFEWLIANRPDIYRIDAAPSHVLLSLEYAEVNFIDYLYVYPGYRGLGIGTELMHKLKQTGKAILLEVEPPSPLDPDSFRRRRFYDREGFQRAHTVAFRLPAALTGGPGTDLDVLYWAPTPVPDERIYQWMHQMYLDLYAAIPATIYGRPYPAVHEALSRKAGPA